MDNKQTITIGKVLLQQIGQSGLIRCRRWRGRLGYLIVLAACSISLIICRLVMVWSPPIWVSLAIYVFALLPVFGLAYLWWLITEILDLPGLMRGISEGALSLTNGEGEREQVDNLASTSSAKGLKPLGLVRQTVRSLLKVLGLAFDVSDVGGVVGMAMSLANPIVAILLSISLMLCLMWILIAIGWVFFWFV